MAAPLFVSKLLVFKAFSCGHQVLSLRALSTSSWLMKGLVLGVFKGEKDEEFSLTKAAQSFQETRANKLSELIELSGLNKKGKERIFYGLDKEYTSVAVVSLGKKDPPFNQLEELDEARENIRAGVAAGVKQLKEAGVKTIYVDPCGDPESAAEGSHLCSYVYDELKTDEKKKVKVDLHCFTEAASDPESVKSAWDRGTTLAEGQILAKYMMEVPANVMTPTRFAEIATERFANLNKVEVLVRDKAWAEDKKMGSYLSVAKGSSEPPKFVEVHYKGGKDGEAPLVFVGKGITFDSGGISIKPSACMEDMRADMGGAACVLSAIYTVARLGVPINVIGLMPLCENLPSGSANKPGDVVTAMNGKTIQVDNTDAEGRLVLADALVYAETFKPRGIVDVATLTGGMIVALGSSAAGVFSNSSMFWEAIHKAGMKTGDRVWRMPLFQHFSKQVTESHLADLNNISSAGRWGSPCTAAAFLREFITNENWMHVDIAGVGAMMGCKSSIPYMSSTMTGRPTRTLVEFMSSLTKQ